MGYASSQLKQEAEIAKRFAAAVLATMDRQPPINAISYDLQRYRTETGLSTLSARRKHDLENAAKKLGLLTLVTPSELCFVRLSGDEHNRTEYLTNAFHRSRSV